MMKNRPKMASNGPDGPILSIFGLFSALAFPFGQKNEKIGSNKALQSAFYEASDFLKK